MCRTRSRGPRPLENEPNGGQAAETKEGVTDSKNPVDPFLVPRLKAGEEAEHTKACEAYERDGSDDSDQSHRDLEEAV
jgi:hypothetical protein